MSGVPTKAEAEPPWSLGHSSPRERVVDGEALWGALTRLPA